MKFLFIILFSIGQAYAGPKVKIDVPGMVCQMCVFGMQKNFSSVVNDSQNDVIVDLDNKIVTVKLKEKIPDDEIKKRVNDAGYNAEKIIWVE